ncbi:MAG: TonB-dependent receptor [bacterium]|nr:TonB-dependent receptor [bacterium]
MYAFPSYSEGSLNHFRKTHITLGFRKELSDTFRIDGKLGYCRSHNDFDYDLLFQDFIGVQEMKSRSWEMELGAFVETPRLTLSSGLHYRIISHVLNRLEIPFFGLNNNAYLADGDTIDERALFAQANWRLSKKLRIVAGIRVEHITPYDIDKKFYENDRRFEEHEVSHHVAGPGVEVIPRLAVMYTFNDRNVLKLLYGKAVNSPAFFQNSDQEYYGGDVLENEEIQTLELNYIGYLSPSFSINASLFHNSLNDLINRSRNYDPEQTYRLDNSIKMITNGIELTLEHRPVNNTRFELSGIIQTTTNKEVGWEFMEDAYSPKFLGYFKASYRTEKFSLSLTGRYVDEMETQWEPFYMDRRIGDKVGGYFACGANLRLKKLFGQNLYLNLRISNLLGTTIRYPATLNNYVWAKKGTIGIGRTFLLNLGWKF